MAKKMMRAADGKYHINGKVYDLLVGSRAQVHHGTAYKTTPGSKGLTANDLIMNKNGHLVSKKKSATAKKEKRLEKAGYFTRKGVFGAVKMDSKKHSKGKKAHTVGGKRHKRKTQHKKR